jgi:hypothetical protein|tara:strand:- start:2807 stop:3055 length:249 start_codon:yes stop_codon:yes gene_type:complete
MFGQLGISIYQVVLSTNSYTLLNLLIIIVLWLSSFLQFLPIHSDISKGEISEKMLNSLVAKKLVTNYTMVAIIYDELHCAIS